MKYLLLLFIAVIGICAQSQTLQLLTCFEEGQHTLGEEGINTKCVRSWKSTPAAC
ncbi:MAG: hypothetical protein R2813_05860 [Flavobacteriales bacterium]